MRKIRKWKKRFSRIFAVVLAAVMLFTMPGTASVVAVEAAGTDDTSETSTELMADEVTEEPKAETGELQEADDDNLDELEAGDKDTEETETGEEETSEEELPDGAPEENKMEEELSTECICEILCTGDSINEDCPVCSAEDADVSCCEGVEENTEDDEQGDMETEESIIRVIEKLIAALPGQVTEDNAKEVRAQLDKILALYRELTEEEQEQVDLSRCLELQEELDTTNAPMQADEHADYTEGDEASVTIDGTTTYYTMLEEAFSAANEKNATITMLADAECTKSDSAGSPLNITGGVVTLDMGGHILSGQGSGYRGGIVGVSGGSLTVQGNGTVQVPVRGVSCSGGTLTILDTKFNLVGNSYPAFFAIAIMDGGGATAPKVSINGGEIAGPALEGQINHAYGTTTINDVTMTGTTSDNPRGVYYYSEGTLKINGGSFSNITVDEKTGVSSVEELLGDGVTYKHQGGTWTTKDELSAMSIGNVTVEKVPLTINPSAETSWYYGSGEHILTMNAQPVAGGTVTYEWYDGDINLNCAVDAYSIPKNLDAGSYTYTCKATCDEYTLSHNFTFKIKKSGTQFEEDGVAKAYLMGTEQYTFSVDEPITVIARPTATGAAPTNAAMMTDSLNAPAGGQMALFVGDTQISEPVNAEQDGSYSMMTTAQDVLAAAGEPGTIELIARFAENSNQAGAESKVKITITAAAKVTTSSATYYYGTIEDAWSSAQHNSPATVTLLANAEVSEMLTTTSATPIILDAGAYTLTLPTSGLSFGGSVRLRGGTFQSSDSITLSGKPVIDLLDDSDGICRAFYKDGHPVPLEANQNALAAGTYEVKECSHAGNVLTYEAQKDGATHKKTCLACGMTWDTETHAPGADHHCSGCNAQLAAQVETDGTAACYTTIETAWTAAKGKTATVTLLDNVETREALEIAGGDTITFDGGAYTLTIKLATANAYAITVNGGKLTMQSGTITAKGIVSNCVKAAGGTFVFTGGKVEAADNGINAAGGIVQISGGETSGGTGLFYSGDGTVKISGGTFTGTSHAVYHYTGKVGSLLDHTDITRYAYYQGEIPVTEGLESKSLPTGTYTVKECKHDVAGVTRYQHNDGTETHTLTCLACGYTEAAENCSYSFSGNVGTCPDCKDALTVSVTGMDSLTYDGNEKKPEVTVMRDGTALDVIKYAVAYNGNKYAGTNTASVTVIIGSSQGTYTERFSIGRAALTITASDQTITYGQSIQQGVAQVTVSRLCDGDTLSGVTITPSSNQVTVENKTVAPSAAVIMNSNDQNVTANYDITYVPGKLTIDKAAGTLTVPENTISKIFGDEEFSLNCATNGDGKISYESSNEGVAAVSADGTVLIKGAGETRITVSLAEGANYTGGARQEITVTVAKAAAPAIMGETGNYTYTNGSNGAVTIDVAGKLPKGRGRTEYTVTTADEKGILSDVSVDGNGNLVFTVLGNRSEGDTASITVRAEMANYETAAFTVDIVLVEKKTVEPQAGGSVSISGGNTLIYGQTLSDLTFGSVTFVEQGTDKRVEGTLAWKNSSLTPAAGTTGAEWVFTPANSSEYAEMTGTVPVTVAKAIPDADTPTAGAVTYDPSGKLSSVTLTGGSAAWTVGGSRVNVEGTWSWKDGSLSPAAGNRGYMAVFTPKDTDNYNTVEREITVTVGRAEPYIEGKVSAAPITYGDSLNASALTGTAQYSSSDGTVVPGSFTWKDGTVKPAVSDSGSTKYTVIFTPDEGTNYSSVETEITLVVKKAENAPDMPSGTMNVPRRCEKVNDVELPSGWQWLTADREKDLEIDVPLSATAMYVGADKDNYENTEVTITITRSDCDHEKTELKDVIPATCEKEGYSGDTWCAVCGELLQKGSVTPITDHKGGVASCREQAVCEMCKKPYGSYDANRHINTERRNAVPASCTVAGNTGDLYCKACGAKVGSGRVIPAVGHNWQEGIIRQPTTSEEGLRRYTCRNCGASREEAIPKLPSEAHTHSYSVTETRAASCTEAGIKVYSCSCGDSYTESTPASGHSYHSLMAKAPTVSEEGVMTYSCTRCGHSYTAAISRLEAPASAPGIGDGTGTGNRTKSGTGNTVKQGTGSTENPGAGTGTAQEGRPDTGIPFIKDADGKIGWDVIRAEEEKARDGNVINVDMNGSVVVPGDIFDSIRGRDITITFDMGNGILWSVDGKSITTDKAGDTDFSVKTGVSAVPVDIVNNATGESYSIQISLAYEGEFGFTAVLSIGLGEENAGYTASLYYYNESTGELEFICSDTVAEDGTVSLAFTHASDYVIAIDGDKEEGGEITESAEPEGDGGSEDNMPPESPKTGQGSPDVQGGKNVLWLSAGILALAGIVFAGVFARKKKEEKDSE